MGYLAMALIHKTAEATPGTAQVDTTPPPVKPATATTAHTHAAPQNTDTSIKPSAYGINTMGGRIENSAAGDAGTLVPTDSSGHIDNDKIKKLNDARRYNKYMKDIYQKSSEGIDLGKEKSLADVNAKIKTNADRLVHEDVAKHRGTDMEELGHGIRGETSPAETYARQVEAQRNTYAGLSPEEQRQMNERSGPGVNIDATKMSKELQQDVNAQADPALRSRAGGDVLHPKAGVGNLWQTTPLDASVNEEKNPQSYINRVVSEKAFQGDPGIPGQTPAKPGFTQQMTQATEGMGDKAQQAVQQERSAAYNKYAPWVAGGLGLLGGAGLMGMLGNMGIPPGML